MAGASDMSSDFDNVSDGELVSAIQLVEQFEEFKSDILTFGSK